MAANTELAERIASRTAAARPPIAATRDDGRSPAAKAIVTAMLIATPFWFLLAFAIYRLT